MSNEERKNFISSYNEYAPRLYKYCYYRLYSPTLAEECVQETYTHAWSYMVQGKTINNIKSFLYRVSRNWIIDVSRKKISSGNGEVNIEESELDKKNIAAVSYDGQKIIEQHLLLDEARKLIQRLPLNYREVLTMRYIDDLTPREIAKITKQRPNAVSIKINRAIKKLRLLTLSESPK
jgi:RNA polymerase sigma-70 factor, ECF subfamily